MIYVQRLPNMNTNCDVLGQLTVPIFGQLFGYMDEPLRIVIVLGWSQPLEAN